MGVSFKDGALLDLALTHSSYVHENRLALSQCNERLEFLGDAVLNLCVAEMLVTAFPEEPEGALSKRRAALVNQKQLARLANEIALGPALKLGKGEEKTGGRLKESLLGDAFEAVVGALYLDQGLIAVQDYLRRLFGRLIPESKKVETSQDYKTRLQEYHQRLYKKSPRYIVEGESGPDHLKTFKVRIEFQGKILGKGVGRSKREAEQDAARMAFVDIQHIELPPKATRQSRPARTAKRPQTTTADEKTSTKESKSS